jgi:gluconokinase
VLKGPKSAPLVLSLDVGTSSARAALYDAAGARLSRGAAVRRYLPTLTSDGGATLDPDTLVATVAGLLDDAVSDAGDLLGQVACVAPAAFWHSLVGVTADGSACTPLYLWMDQRGHAAAAKLRERLDERLVHARTGCVLHATYLPARLQWLKAHEPGLAARAGRWVSFSEYLLGQLFGEAPSSISMASATGLFDQHRCDWDDELLAASGIGREALPPLAAEDQVLRGLRSPWRGRWPSLASLPWMPAVGDGAASNVGAGCTTPERAALMVGTSVALRVCFRTDAVAIPWGVWGYRLDRRRVCLGGALNDGGSLFAWLKQTLRLPDGDALEAGLAALPPDAHGLTLLPLWGGERSPGWAAAARGAISGLGLHTTPMEILRAALEGIALRCAELDGLLREAVPRLSQVVATGGGLLGSAAWLQIMADALGQPLVASAEREASSRGAALAALERLGLLPGAIEDVPPPDGLHYEPDPARHQLYRAAQERQRALYGRLVR